MNETLLAIVAGLFGSAITLVLKSIFDRTQLDRAHYQSLQREYYERKLDTAEKAIAQHNILLSAIHMMELQQKLLLEDSSENTVITDAALSESIAKTVGRTSDDFFSIAYAVPLYFDVDVNRYWFSGSLTKLISVSREMWAIENQKRNLQVFNETGEVPNRVSSAQIEALEAELEVRRSAAVSLLGGAKEETLDLIADIRAQLLESSQKMARIPVTQNLKSHQSVE